MLHPWTESTLPWCETQTLKSPSSRPSLRTIFTTLRYAHDLVSTCYGVFDFIEENHRLGFRI